MPARTVEFIQDGYYHLYNRGAGRQPIFREAANYEFVLRRMKQYAAEFGISVIVYCLMPNHYHWLLRQDGGTAAGLLAQRVFNSYTKAFNKMYSRTGTLFEGRYKAKAIEEEAHLLHLCRYIHANPVKNGLTNEVTSWPYSNYHEWIGARPGTLVDRGFVQDMFPDIEQYVRFVQDYLQFRRLPEELASYLDDLEASEKPEKPDGLEAMENSHEKNRHQRSRSGSADCAQPDRSRR